MNGLSQPWLQRVEVRGNGSTFRSLGAATKVESRPQRVRTIPHIRAGNSISKSLTLFTICW
jgi:hypothetical protein